jgi:hypothetical protein
MRIRRIDYIDKTQDETDLLNTGRENQPELKAQPAEEHRACRMPGTTIDGIGSRIPAARKRLMPSCAASQRESK